MVEQELQKIMMEIEHQCIMSTYLQTGMRLLYGTDTEQNRAGQNGWIRRK
tara:strand:- start:379 stop:528 length:150 start_codon:yes stop_codon:yes gene_type:complete